MRKAVFIILIFLSGSLMAQSTHDLTIKVNGYRHLNGTVFIALYNSEENYMKVEKASYKAIFQPRALTDTYIFHDLPDAVYAATLFYDENANGKLDTNVFGIPKEKNGFSNNAKGMFGPAKFDKAKFVHHANQEIAVTLE